MHARLQADIGLSLGDMSHQLNLDEKQITAAEMDHGAVLCCPCTSKCAGSH